ncbi:MAG: hypothetical protein ACK45I_11620 [Bacteroidota bacterium]|jgi:hypothetical protein
MIKCIGLYSPVPRSGKSEVAKILIKRNYGILPFAEQLKICCVHFIVAITGISQKDARRYIYDCKNEQIPGFPLGITGRVLQQKYGIDFVREMIDFDAWVKAWRRNAESYIQFRNIAADDVRFENEAKAVESIGGQMWLVTSPFAPTDIPPDCKSEGNLNHWKFAVHIVNDGTLEDLEKQVLSHLPPGTPTLPPMIKGGVIWNGRWA